MKFIKVCSTENPGFKSRNECRLKQTVFFLSYVVICGFGICVGIAMMQNDYTITIGWGLGALLWSLGFIICEVH